MSKALFTLALLSSALALPPAAQADTIDDFVLTGNGETLTFSLPATGAYTLHEHFDNFLTSAPGFIDGAPVTVGAAFYVQFFENVPQAPALGIFSTPLTDFPPDLYGSIRYSWFVVPAQFPNPQDEGTFNVTFVPGTYQLSSGSNFLAPPTPRLPFTFIITPETATAPTPEPATLTLLTTGALGILSLAARRKKARQILN